jgi:D-alanine transfer protein
MLKKLIIYQVIPIVIACGLVSVIILLSSPLRSTQTILIPQNLSGEQKKMRGLYDNLLSGEQAEIDFIGSIQNKEQLSILGSSELTETKYAPYYFLPDSLGMSVLAIGHAYHQQLSMLCELLAAKEHISNSKICILLSPSWFQDPAGTNIEAFIEFVRPNFLNKIANDSTISKKYRLHLGAYIHQNSDKINVLSPAMKRLRDDYLETKPLNIESYLSKTIMGEAKVSSTTYSIINKNNTSQKSWNTQWDELSTRIQKDFMANIHTNAMYVNDVYFKEHLLQKNGEVRRGSPDYVDITACEEFGDFNLLVDFMKEQKVQCSFVIQALNPYFYNNLNNYNDLITAVKKKLNDNQIPYLDLFVTEKQDYEPGVLKDVMHLGDYGWMKVNHFLYITYHE